MLKGLDMLISQEAEVPVHITEQPLEAVVLGGVVPRGFLTGLARSFSGGAQLRRRLLLAPATGQLRGRAP